MFAITFILKKIITPFVLPPGIFVLLLLLSGYVFWRKKKLRAARLHIALGILLWTLTIVPVSDFMLGNLESGYSIPQKPRGDVIILLGGGVYEDAPDMTGTGTPSEPMLARVVTAIRLQKQLNVPVIISGGSVYEGRKSEAPIVRRFLIDLGVREDMIIVEGRSRDTIENARYSLEICNKAGYKNPILVTSAFHMKRSLMSFEKAGLKAAPFPAGFKTWNNKHYIWEDYLPHGLDGMAASLREYMGILFYKIAY